jgi:O-antigen ligase
MPSLIRSDFFVLPQPKLLNVARWMLVASAAFLPLGSAPTNIFAAVMLLFLFVAGGYWQHWLRFQQAISAWAALALLIVLALGTIGSSGSASEIETALTKHARILYFVFAVFLLSEGPWARRALYAWMAAMILTLALSYIHSVWAFPLARATRDNAIGDHFIFKHHITQNVMMSVFVIAASCVALREKLCGETQRAWLWAALAALAAINVIFFVAGRTGYVTLFFNVMVAGFIVLPSRWRAPGLVMLLLALALLASLSAHVRTGITSAVLEVVAALQSEQPSSMGQRVEFAQRSMELFRERPWFGWGTGSYAIEFCRVAKTAEWCRLGAYNPHNQYLFFAVQVGVVGLVAYLAWLLAVARDLARAEPFDLALGFCLLATLVLHSMLDSPLFIATEGAWYPLMLGILVAQTHQSEFESGRRSRAMPTTASNDGHSG